MVHLVLPLLPFLELLSYVDGKYAVLHSSWWGLLLAVLVLVCEHDIAWCTATGELRH